MKTLSKYICGEEVEIEVTEQEYAEALEQAIKFLGIETEDEAEEREDEINEFILEYFEDCFEEQLQEMEKEYQDQQDFYDELKSWYNKRTGV